MIFAINGAFCQQNPQKTNRFAQNQPVFLSYEAGFYQLKPLPVLPANFYCTQLGFFCKTELKFEAATRIPFKFRLGSIQYNDWLEGKRNAGILPAP